MTQTRTELPARPLGSSGLAVSEIGFGAWGIGKSMWGPTDDRESLRALREALGRGITLFDTAYAYGHGHSETLLGTLRKEDPGFKVATKVPPKNMEWPAHPRTRLAHAFPPDWVRACAESSLRRLRAERVELLQFHVWTDAWLKDPLWPETLAEIEALKREEKILLFGVSANSDDPDSCLELVRRGLVQSVQVILNLFDQRAAERLLPLCAEKGAGVLARCPFDEGSLAGALTPRTRFEEGDFRNHYFKGERLAESCRRAEALKGLLVEGGHARTLAEAALKFCLSWPQVSTVIPGMRTAAHVRENALAADGRYFGKELLKALEAHAWVRDFYR